MRKTVSVLFCDVTGSTALGERLDPESFRQVMSRYFEAARAVIEGHGGTVEKFIGDAVMAVFGVPVLHEDDALRAVRAAAGLREQIAVLNRDLEADFGAAVSVRTGVNTGQVVTGTGERLATGDAVNLAARLEQAAAPGEIVIGPQTWRLVRGAVAAEPLAPLALKGKSAPVTAYRLLQVRADGRLMALIHKDLLRPDRAVLPGEDAFRFRHLLIRDAAYQALAKADRAQLHERFARWLEERGAELVELDEITGYHLEQAFGYRCELGGVVLGPDRMAGLPVMAAQHGQVSHHHPRPHEPSPAGRARAGSDQHKPVHPLGPVQRQGHGDAPAQRDPGQVRTGQVQPVHQARDVGGHLFDRVRPWGLGRAARASVVDRDHPEPRCQRTRQHAHLRHIQAEAAQRHQRGTRTVRLVVQLDVIHGD
jgi:class 3 adenylate cyclase